MQSALIAGEGRERFVAIDTKSVAAGQAAVVLTTARYLREHPEATLEEAAAFVNGLIGKIRMGFIPGDLDYLRAGGRVSNAAYLGAKILGRIRSLKFRMASCFPRKNTAERWDASSARWRRVSCRAGA